MENQDYEKLKNSIYRQSNYQLGNTSEREIPIIPDSKTSQNLEASGNGEYIMDQTQKVLSPNKSTKVDSQINNDKRLGVRNLGSNTQNVAKKTRLSKSKTTFKEEAQKIKVTSAIEKATEDVKEKEQKLKEQKELNFILEQDVLASEKKVKELPKLKAEYESTKNEIEVYKKKLEESENKRERQHQVIQSLQREINMLRDQLN